MPPKGKRLSRRSFIRLSVGAMTSLTLCGGILSKLSSGESKLKGNQSNYFPDNLRIPPLFCIAYITPDAPGQGGQEHMVARYPLTVVPQDNRYQFKKWRDKIKSINPQTKMLAYQMVIEETMVPGPGHNRLRKVDNAWCTYPGGIVPTTSSLPNRMRFFDPRNNDWRSRFLDACRATLSSYPFDGLFLDQCSVFLKAHPLPSVREEMKTALQMTILELRREFPKKILVGNSRYNWSGLNGEMIEGRPSEIKKELAPFRGHTLPRVELVQTYLRSPYDIETVKREMSIAHSNGGFYGACVNAQHVLWFDQFDQVITKFHNKY